MMAEAFRLLDACGADVIELGMPFSDPYADGPVIQVGIHNYIAKAMRPLPTHASARSS